MASTYSDLKFELIGTGEQSGVWGTTTNDNIGTAIEQALVGLGNPIFTTDANLTISLTNTVALQTARALVLNATSSGSLTATRELVVPTIEKQYIVQNNTTGGQSITVKTTAGTGITITNGRKAHLYVDGVNVVQMFDFVDINGGAVDGTPIGASSASTGAFTTLAASGAVTLSGGTANGVTYLNGSKVLTSGSALTFDGTVLTASNSASTAGVFKATSTTAQVANLQAQNDAGTAINLGVFGSAAGTFGTLGAGTPFLSTSAATMVQNVQNASGNFVWGIGATPSEQMRLTSTGLGIGTSSPAEKLQVVGKILATGDARVGVKKAGSDSVGAGPFFSLQNADASREWFNQLGASNTLDWWFYNGSSYTKQATLDSAGNLGLGVTPSAWSSSAKALEIGIYAGFYRNASGITAMSFNSYQNTSNIDTYRVSANAAGKYEIAGNHAWYVAPSGTAGNAITFTQAMTLDASGRLLVGVTSGSERFEVSGSINSIGQSTNFGAGAERAFMDYTPASSTARIGHLSGGSGSTSGSLAFFTNNDERARIDSSGNLLVGTSSGYSGRRLDVRGTTDQFLATLTNSNAAPLGWQILYNSAAPNNTVSQYLTAQDTGGERFTVRSNGGIANYSANNVNLSDRREKTNFAPAKSYLDTICAIPVQTFNYADQNMEEDPGLTLGVVAQDVQAVAPELVMESNWGSKDEPKQRLSIYQTDLQYALMKALQELKAEFDAYKATHP